MVLSKKDWELVMDYLLFEEVDRAISVMSKAKGKLKGKEPERMMIGKVLMRIQNYEITNNKKYLDDAVKVIQLYIKKTYKC